MLMFNALSISSIAVPEKDSIGFLLLRSIPPVLHLLDFLPTTIHDFAGASVLGQKDTKLDTVIDQMDGVNHLPPVESVPNMISRLDQGTCDAIVINLENAPGYLALNPDYVIVEFAEGDGFDLGFTGSCVGLRKSDTDLLQQVNASLAEYSQDELTALWDWAVENQPT